jgi:S1-C subfamily serine protease
LDLAIIKITPDKIPIKATEAKLDCVNKPVVGRPVGAFGHPFSLSFSGTRGIISGEKYRWGRVWVQTDAPINSGNSGGPLISLTSGKVVGISSATLSKSRSEGLNFAVPMTHACKVINLLKRGMDPTPPYIPVSFAYDDDNDSELIAAVIYKNQPTSWPLKIGDRLISLANTPKEVFKNQAMLVHQLRGVRGKVDVAIDRRGKKRLFQS